MSSIHKPAFESDVDSYRSDYLKKLRESDKGCTNNLFDYYTTWSLVIFILSLVAYLLLFVVTCGKYVFVARSVALSIVWWGIANAFAVGIVGHIAMSFPANAEQFTNDAHTRNHLVDDSMQLLPLLVWAVILTADSDRIVPGKAHYALFALLPFVMVVTLYYAIPLSLEVLPAEMKFECTSLADKSSTGYKSVNANDKLKLVYYRFQDDPLWMALAMPVLFVLFLVMLVVVSVYKKYIARKDRK